MRPNERERSLSDLPQNQREHMVGELIRSPDGTRDAPNAHLWTRILQKPERKRR